jgi:hypothetical protein
VHGRAVLCHSNFLVSWLFPAWKTKNQHKGITPAVFVLFYFIFGFSDSGWFVDRRIGLLRSARFR